MGFGDALVEKHFQSSPSEAESNLEDKESIKSENSRPTSPINDSMTKERTGGKKKAKKTQQQPVTGAEDSKEVIEVDGKKDVRKNVGKKAKKTAKASDAKAGDSKKAPVKVAAKKVERKEPTGVETADEEGQVKRVLDSLRGQRIISRNEADGFYYPGLVEKCLNIRSAKVRFDDLKPQVKVVPTRFCIPICGALSHPILREQDSVLVRVKNIKNKIICYAPGCILCRAEDESQANKFYTVKLYNGKLCQSKRGDLIKIGETRYNFLVKNLSMKLANDKSAEKPHIEVERTVDEDKIPTESKRAGKRGRRKSSVDREGSRTRDSSGSRNSHELMRTQLKEGQEKISELERQLRDQRMDLDSQKRKMKKRILKLQRKQREEESKRAGRDSEDSFLAQGKHDSGSDFDDERPPARMAGRNEDQSSELARLASRESDALGPDDSASQADRRAEERLEEGEEVLAVWPDDAWYYRCIVETCQEDGTYVVVDGCGDREIVQREDIIRECDDENIPLEHGSTVVALHPAYAGSYAPGVIVGEREVGLWRSVRFYDGAECSLPREECYAVSPAAFENLVAYITQCEKKWVGCSVVAREDRTGIYLPAVVKSRVGSGRQYKIEWPDERSAVQHSEYIFGALTRRHELQAGDRVLACTDPTHQPSARRQFVYLPGWVTSLSEDKQLNIKFVDGSSVANADPMQCFWLSREFFDDAVNYWRSKRGPKEE